MYRGMQWNSSDKLVLMCLQGCPEVELDFKKEEAEQLLFSLSNQLQWPPAEDSPSSPLKPLTNVLQGEGRVRDREGK